MAPAVVVYPSAIVLEVLNRNNYDEWSVRVKTYLMANDLWDVVEPTCTIEPPNEEDELWKKKNVRALHAIQISCGTKAFSFIATISTARMAWDTLEKELKSEWPVDNVVVGRVVLVGLLIWGFRALCLK